MIAPCLKCGSPTEHQVTTEGLVEWTGFVCSKCLDPILEDMAERRRQFQELLDAGASRAVANTIMIGRLEQWSKS